MKNIQLKLNKRVGLIFVSSLLISLLVGIQIGLAQTGTTPTFSTGPYAGAPTCTVYPLNSTYYSAKDSYGAIFSQSSDISTILNAIYIANPYADVVLNNGVYSTSNTITMPETATLRGETIGKREYMPTIEPSASFPSTNYIITVTSTTSGTDCGEISNLYLYNNNIAANRNGILLNATTTSSFMRGFTVEKVRFTYLMTPLKLMGTIWESTFTDLQIVGYNTGFKGYHAIELEKDVGGAIPYREGPKLNYFTNIKIRNDGGFDVGFYFGNDTAYNKIVNLDIYKGGYTYAGIYFTGRSFSNSVTNYRNSDNNPAVTTSASSIVMNGPQVFGNAIYQSNLSPMADSLEVIKYLGWAYNNYVQFLPLGAIEYGTYVINGTQAGAGNSVNILPPHANQTTGIAWSYSGASRNVTFSGFQAEDSGSATATSYSAITYKLAGTATSISAIACAETNASNTDLYTEIWIRDATGFGVFLKYANGTYFTAPNYVTVLWSAKYSP